MEKPGHEVQIENGHHAALNVGITAFFPHGQNFNRTVVMNAE
jgi:hypothetical protein